MSDANSGATSQPDDVPATAATAADAAVEATRAQLEKLLDEKDTPKAQALKEEGNALFGRGEWADAHERYGAALAFCAETEVELLAVLCNNRGACNIMMTKWNEAVSDCTEALRHKPNWVKALARRAKAWEETDRHFDALEDWKAIVAAEPSHADAQRNVRRLEPVVAEKTEKQKEEVLGKLKDLGNSLLGKFGMSLDNFKATKDPNTGSYSISYGNK